MKKTQTSIDDLIARLETRDQKGERLNRALRSRLSGLLTESQYDELVLPEIEKFIRKYL